MKNKKYYFFLGLIFAIGFLIRILFSLNQPFWLDEKYSVFFATQFSSSELLINFSNDANPGLYYIFVKYLLKITTNIFNLRLITSIIPQIFGAYILTKALKNKKESLLLSTLILINPFFIELSWQLRGYSLSMLVASISYFLIIKLKEKYSKKILVSLIMLLIIGNMIHYAMYLFSFFTCVYLIYDWKNKSLILKTGILFIVSLSLLSQFFIQNNNISNYKSQFTEVSWISKPNITNIPTVYLFSFGMLTNKQLYNYNQPNIGIIAIEYILLISILIFIKNKKNISTILFLIPYLSILGISIVIPFLSKSVFFTDIIPDISIFIPRIHIPFIIIFWITITKIFLKKFEKIKKRSEIIYKIVFINLIIYLLHVNFINYSQVNNDFIERQNNLNLIKNNYQIFSKKTHIWPHWILIEAIDLNNLSEIDNIKNLKKSSKESEKNFYLEDKKMDITEFQIFTYDPIMSNKKTIQEHCETKENIGSFSKLNCNKF